MVKRSLGILTLVGLLLVGVLATAAVAAEGPEVEFLEYEEIVERAGESGGEFLPEEYERPGWFDYLNIPLIALGVLITTLVLFRYLMAQPRFSKEAEERSRR